MKNAVVIGVCALVSLGAYASPDYLNVIGGVKDNVGFVPVSPEDLNTDGGQNSTSSTPQEEGGRFEIEVDWSRYSNTWLRVRYNADEKPSWVSYGPYYGVTSIWNLKVNNSNATVTPYINSMLNSVNSSTPNSIALRYRFSHNWPQYYSGCSSEYLSDEYEVVVSNMVWDYQYVTEEGPTMDVMPAGSDFFIRPVGSLFGNEDHRYFTYKYVIEWDSFVPSEEDPCG
ncbi:hypothetical protein A6E01_20245 (plasmid) [Vibrio breoganii]|uniref:Uncharacterized protein n=1 Tax=Vibrio breoganii TaxID=553239 RepID=A0AAN0XZK6_9VIBR|nr:hypothetical protein [Vibrio breoganii]ANO35545.1 hypothetical protein A6E01_20245 [Vibrio breoganii]